MPSGQAPPGQGDCARLGVLDHSAALRYAVHGPLAEGKESDFGSR
jgi:hypothetical protein